mmetsp:Transcript_33874/g.40967  ORF Transcript_33874/g.40967 Transcript_33874/m.40967 type:complete len:140 (-) Transcript_33874:178-597(-)
MSCKVCEKCSPKYKCPTCRLPYCSVACYKLHKEVPCSPANVVKRKQPISTEIRRPKRKFETEDEDDEICTRLERRQFEQLVASPKIRSILRDCRVQQLLCDIDKTPSGQVEKALADAMNDASCRTLFEEILDTVSVSKS